MSLLSPLFDPTQEAALVTGAGNGIGRAIAQALVGEGLRTVFADERQDLVAAAIAASPRPELAVAWVGDLASRAACDDLLAAAQSAVGQVTHFVHSAAPKRHETDHALAVTIETWERMHDETRRRRNERSGKRPAEHVGRENVWQGLPQTRERAAIHFRPLLLPFGHEAPN